MLCCNRLHCDALCIGCISNAADTRGNVITHLHFQSVSQARTKHNFEIHCLDPVRTVTFYFYHQMVRGGLSDIVGMKREMAGITHGSSSVSTNSSHIQDVRLMCLSRFHGTHIYSLRCINIGARTRLVAARRAQHISRLCLCCARRSASIPQTATCLMTAPLLPSPAGRVHTIACAENIKVTGR